MVIRITRVIKIVCIGSVALLADALGLLAEHPPLILPEQRSVPYVSPTRLPPIAVPGGPTAPPVVSQLDGDAPAQLVNLDNLIRTALDNAQVVRILAASGAASTGQTIYDPAIATATIDQASATMRAAAA